LKTVVVPWVKVAATALLFTSGVIFVALAVVKSKAIAYEVCLIVFYKKVY
jgi:hypothetical protein